MIWLGRGDSYISTVVSVIAKIEPSPDNFIFINSGIVPYSNGNKTLTTKLECLFILKVNGTRMQV
jgi:hypothetical protein